MTPPSNASNELDDLVAAIVDESITPEQSARLQELLRDEALRRHFVQAMGFHASLFNYASEAEGEAAVEPAKAGWSRARRWRVWLGDSARRVTRPTPLSFTVATLVMSLLVVVMAYVVVPIYQARHRTSVAIAEAPRIVAKLSRVQEPEWVEGQVGVAAGSHLLAGHRLQLKSGLAEVTFNDGAVVVVQGPARFVVNDTGTASLQQGRIRALVPPAAVGFKVSTPQLEIVDLGTEFGVEVDSKTTTEVQVLKGRVSVSSHRQPASVQPMVLGKGQAWKIFTGGGAGRAVASAPQRFAMSIVDPKVQVLDAVDDVQLLAWGPNNNFGAREDFDVGQLQGQRSHALLRFDLSSLEGKIDRLVGVTLRLHPNTDASYFPWASAGEIALHRVSDVNAAWAEGSFAAGGGGPLSGSADATWNFRQHASERWAGASGASRSGIDYDATPLAKVGYVSRTGYPLDFRLSGDLEFLRDWIAGKSNGGFILRETTGKPQNRINFHSSESPVTAARPRLIITYLPKVAKADEVIDPRDNPVDSSP